MHQHACLFTLAIVAFWRVWRPNASENRTVFGPKKLDMYLPKIETEILTPQPLFKRAKWTKRSKIRIFFFENSSFGLGWVWVGLGWVGFGLGWFWLRCRAVPQQIRVCDETGLRVRRQAIKKPRAQILPDPQARFCTNMRVSARSL